MKTLKAALLAGAILCSISTVHGQVSIGIEIGAPPPPRAVYVQPPQPEPDFVWVQGYWYPVGHHYKWHEGYWTRPPYEGAYWVPSHYEGGHYFVGYWSGNHGRVEHDHHWDRDRDRDFRGHDRDEDDHHRGHGHGHDDDQGHDR